MPRPEAWREARDRLARATRDLEAAVLTLHGPPVLPEMAAYHAQQPVGKAPKAFLAAQDQPVPMTHYLERHAQLCQAIDPSVARLAPSARTLTPYATQVRYPGCPLEPAPTEAQEALRLAREIAQFVRQRLPADASS